MSSFFDKLKKGMGVEIEPTGSEEPIMEKESPAKQEKQARKKRSPKKLEIKTEVIETEEPREEARKEGKEIQAKKEKWFEQEGQLAVDVYETNGDLVIQSTIAGVKPDDLDISIESDRVSIKGERAETEKVEGKNYFYQECYWGQFSREIILPEETDPSRAEASMKQGILTIRIPKIERQKKRKIAVKS